MPALFAGMIGATAMFAWGVFSFLGLPMIQADQQWQHLGHPFLDSSRALFIAGEGSPW